MVAGERRWPATSSSMDSMNPPLVGLMMLLFESRASTQGSARGYSARALGVRALQVTPPGGHEYRAATERGRPTAPCGDSCRALARVGPRAYAAARRPTPRRSANDAALAVRWVAWSVTARLAVSGRDRLRDQPICTLFERGTTGVTLRAEALGRGRAPPGFSKGRLPRRAGSGVRSCRLWALAAARARSSLRQFSSRLGSGSARLIARSRVPAEALETRFS